MEQFVEGIQLREIFRNKDNDFAICSLLLMGHNATEEILNAATKPAYDADIPNGFNGDDYGTITISGYFPPLDDTRSYHFTGRWTEHQRYGWQFQIKTFKSNQVAVSSASSVIAYLSSDVFKGIGKKTATAIVETLGVDAIDTLLKNPTKIKAIKGLSQKQQDVVLDTLKQRQGDERILGPLYSYGISPKFVLKILKLYKDDALDIILKNPYRLITDIEGIGFVKADDIAKAIGIASDDPRRISAVLIHVLNRVSAQEGHTYVLKDQLIETAYKFLAKDVAIDVGVITAQIEKLIEQEEIIVDGAMLFLPYLYEAEVAIAQKIKQMGTEDETEQSGIQTAFEEVKSKLDITYSPLQEAAIIKSLSASISIITGGPGTGKTTVVNGLLKVYDQMYRHQKKQPVVKLASPTGRAAKRMEETTAKTAMTIHRLLGYDRDGVFAVNEDEPLEADLVILDEVSMLDTALAFQFFSSLQKGTKVILVGDDNQLPSVGPGQVLKDLIDSQLVPLTRLTEIHRQAGDSSVISLAYEVNAGRLPDDLFQKKADRLFVSSQNEHILNQLLQVVRGAITKGYSARDVQILIPMYRGPLGIDGVNLALQELFNPPADDKEELIFGSKTFREGDKVLQLVNFPDEGVMNGDVGEVVRVLTVGNNAELLVDFDGNEVTYKKENLLSLTHAYAMSIHKSQGSEYPVVIMPITRSYWIMLQRKLLYTGITRAKRSLILIGEADAFKYGVENGGAARQTYLKERLVQKKATTDDRQKPTAKASDVNIYQDYFDKHNIPFLMLDEAGMANVSPYDFLN